MGVFQPKGRWRLWAIGLGLLIIVGVAPLGVRMSEKPEFCAMCHPMLPMYRSWSHSAHARNAGCNDCHSPHDNYVKKVAFKAYTGVKDAWSMYVAGVPDSIRITSYSADIIERNCVRCHSTVVENVHSPGGKRCFDCHRFTPHLTPGI